MDIFYLSIIVAVVCCLLVFCLKYLHLLRWISGQAYVLSKPHDFLSAEEVLDLLKTTKPFPVSCQKGWTIHGFHHGLRVWFHHLIMQNNTTKVFGSFTRVRASSQVVLQLLRDVSVTREWKPGVVTTSMVRTNAPPDAANKPRSAYLPVQHDIVKEEYVTQAKDKGLDSLWQAHVTHTCTVEISRYWHREDNGVCWHLQVDEADTAWLFLLAQPVEELDHCVVTVVMGFGSNYRLTSPPEMVAMTLGSLDNFIRNRRLQMTPLSSLTLPSQAQLAADEMAAAGESRESLDVTRKRETKLMTKFRSLLEKSSNNSGVKVDASNLQRYNSILRYQPGSKESSASREPSLDSVEGVLPPDREGAQEGGELADNSEENQGLPLRRAPSESESGSPSHQRSESPPEGIDSVALTKYRLMANQAAAELLAQVVQASNIELDKPCEEQISASGGWMFAGCENDVIILKKYIQNGSTLQCYMGKGLVHAPPKTVWEAVKNPRTRFTYDESLKKIDVLQSLGDGMKIVYLYHEVVQLLKKEQCDFCLLQSERTEGEKYVLAYQSVDDDFAPKQDGVIRAKLLPSGWIIESAKKDRKVYSMVTYLMQMDFGPARPNMEQLPLEQMASKQPVSISFLQQYLKPAVLLARQKSSPAPRIP